MSDTYTEKVYYLGSINIENNAYRVKLLANGKVLSKTFSWNGDKELALQKAKQYRRERSTALGLNVVCKWKNISDEKRAYFAGFLDGDGTISWTCKNMCVSAAQSSNTNQPPDILIQFQEIYGGNIHLSSGSNCKKSPYQCIIYGRKALQILKDIAKFGILKRDQAQLVLDTYFADDDDAFKRSIPKQLTDEIKEKLKKAKQLASYQSV